MSLTWFRCVSLRVHSLSTGLRAASSRFRWHSLALLLTAAFVSAAGEQTAGQASDGAELRAIPDHVPAWASPEHFVAAVPGDERLEALTLVLDRGGQKQHAFEKLLADQQDPTSPSYHQWLTPSQIGERFGLSTDELNSLTEWLQSEGLHVDWVAPGRNFIGFSGAAGDVARAFQAELNYYDVEGDRKMSVATDPMVPGELAAKIKAVRGLYTIEDKPLHKMRVVRSESPEMATSTGEHFIQAADFDSIYDVTGGYTGRNVTIGIVGRSRVSFADLANYEGFGGGYVKNPIEIVPTGFGGVDPGPARTMPPSAGVSIGDQAEATLDVERAGSLAGSRILLVVTTSNHGDIGADSQYLIQTEPIPAPIINISFGECEAKAGKVGVEYWDRLFEQAAAEGISVFVASGDSGASGCDADFSAPPIAPAANSANYICSSSYVTCVGGTEFNDVNTDVIYWYPQTGRALEYIPEGAWNEPLNVNSEIQVAATGGGYSRYIPTPAWQVGEGVPATRIGRYTPDVAFSASEHDAYFGCMAAAGGNCLPKNGVFHFLGFSGTSAAAPDMAGIMSFVVGRAGGKPQGNLNPELYLLAASYPSVFHDVTVGSSGVNPCNLHVPSMCNNSIPGVTGATDSQAGFLVTRGYDEATGLGSLEVNTFLNALTLFPIVPLAITGQASDVTQTSATLSGKIYTRHVKTEYWFAYGTDSSLAGKSVSSTSHQWINPASGQAGLNATLTKLLPGTQYYSQLQIANVGGTVVKGAVLAFETLKKPQTVSFVQPVSPRRYGVSPIRLVASASSKLPIEFQVISGPATVDGTMLRITGAGTVVVAATQPGDVSYVASQVQRTITIKRAPLTFTAKSESMTQGSIVPALQFSVMGLVNGDVSSAAKKGLPAITTTATSA